VAQFCPIDPQVQSSAVLNGSENMLFDSSFKCIGSIDEKAEDRLSVRAYRLLSTQFTFSGDDATMLVEQFMDQVMNRIATDSNWEYFKIINRIAVMINAIDETNIAQTIIVSIPAIIVDCWYSQGVNNFRNVKMYTIYAGKGFVVQYLPNTNIQTTPDNRLQQNIVGFDGGTYYGPVVHDIFMIFSPMRSVQ